ncbi:hypothetical protein HFP15_03625 [Amycolatopsis sp. K13G38]|uniref:Restriction endonuclease n=1 Tax=Amycolatopsis acididurans TaxID=2724524 RepID=A0ABX1IWV3_9PSEU|nr:hypothetical protein [Amycolatopsis acididurans]NKQ51968.1 hypothetical protein [Amycolatopsis acididurans]
MAADEPDSHSDLNEALHTGAELSRTARVAASLSALALGGAGGTAVFMTDNQAGTAVLLAAGALFGLIGLSGRLPSRIKFGDNEVQMPPPIAKAVAKRIEDAEPEEAEELVAAVVNANPSGSQARSAFDLQVAAGRRLYAMVYEQDVGAVLRALVRARAVDLRSDDRVFDFVLEGKRRVAVEVKYGLAGASAQTIGSLVGRAAMSGHPEVVFVTNRPFTGRLQRLWEDAVESGVVRLHLVIGETAEELREQLEPLVADL